MSRGILEADVQALAGLATAIRPEYDEQGATWEGSPFAWIKFRPSSSQRGAIAAKLVERWCVANGLAVTRAGGSQCDRIVGGMRTEIKSSTLWGAGSYKFQQFRDQDYAIAICLGLSPFDAHCWVIPKTILKLHVIGHTPQHAGKEGKDTAWLDVNPQNVQGWLAEYGGSLGFTGGRSARVEAIGINPVVKREPRAMMKYEVIIDWSQEDQAFIAEAPELPGCMADGQTHQEALVNVEVVIREWIETAKELGRPVPEPKGRLVYA